MEKLSNAKKKWIRSLHHKKYREKYGYFIGEGDKLFNELTKNQRIPLHTIVAPQEWWEKHGNHVSDNPNVESYTANFKDIEQISTNRTPQPPLMVFESPGDISKVPETDQPLVIYLDGIRDPGNLGTIMRIADWFGHTFLIASVDTVEWMNPKVIQASMGSFLRIRIIKCDLDQVISQLDATRKIIGASMKGEPIDNFDINNSILVIGNESQGIREGILPHIHKHLSIPGSGHAESLNAGIATAIFCYQSYINKKSH